MATHINSKNGDLILPEHRFTNNNTNDSCYALWKTSDDRCFQVVARKISDRTAADEYIKQMKQLKRLKHANILSYIESMMLGENIILVTESAPKGSLYDYLKSARHPLPSELIFRWSLDIACAVKFIQEERVLHRDIKSSNFLISGNNDRLKLQNFGITTDIFQILKSTGIKDRGSLPWMAPEVIRDKRYYSNSDTYSWAIITWELLTGKEPFAGKPGGLVVWKVTAARARPDVPVHCSKLLRCTLLRCWNPDQRKRQTINEIVSMVLHNRRMFGPEWIHCGTLHVDGLHWHYTRGMTFIDTNRQMAVCCWERPKGGQGAVEIHELLPNGQYSIRYTVRSTRRNWRPWDVAQVEGNLYVVCSYDNEVYRFPRGQSDEERATFSLLPCCGGKAKVQPYCISYNRITNRMVVCLEHQGQGKVVEYYLPDFKCHSISVLESTPSSTSSIDINEEDGRAYLVVSDANGVHLIGKDMEPLCSLQVPSNCTCDVVAFGKGPLADQVFLGCEMYGQESIYRYVGDENNQYILAGCIVEGLKEPSQRGMVVSKDGEVAISERMGHTVRIFNSKLDINDVLYD